MSSSSWPRICPFSVALFVASAIVTIRALDGDKNSKQRTSKTNQELPEVSFSVVFVLGAPGVGKGTQCQLLVERLHWVHLSAGDLLRAERKTNSSLAKEINECIQAGKIVRSEITCQLLFNAMNKAYQETKSTRFLIDGYPRNQGNLDAWEQQTKQQQQNVQFVLNFQCPEDTLIGRLLERGKSSGRTDDTLETVQKRFQTFRNETAPIIAWYKNNTSIPVYDIATDQPVERVYQETVQYFE